MWSYFAGLCFCVGGCGLEKNIDYLHQGCACFRSIWSLVLQWLGIYSTFMLCLSLIILFNLTTYMYSLKGFDLAFTLFG